MIFKVVITSAPLDKQEAEIVKKNPEAFKIGADIDIDGDLGQLAASVKSLMEVQDSVAKVLLLAVAYFNEKHPNYLTKN